MNATADLHNKDIDHQINMHRNRGTFAVFCTLNLTAFVVAHHRACQGRCPRRNTTSCNSVISTVSSRAVLKVGATLFITQGVWNTSRWTASAVFSCPEPEHLLAAYVPVNSCRVPRRHGRIKKRPVRRFWPRPAVLSSTVAQVIEALMSMTEELGGSELPTSGIWFLHDLGVARPCTELLTKKRVC